MSAIPIRVVVDARHLSLVDQLPMGIERQDERAGSTLGLRGSAIGIAGSGHAPIATPAQAPKHHREKSPTPNPTGPPSCAEVDHVVCARPSTPACGVPAPKDVQITE